MVHLVETLHFDATDIYQKEVNFKKFTLRIELFLMLLFLVCSACGRNPKEQAAAAALASAMSDAKQNAVELESAHLACGRLNYPRYIDPQNQIYVENQIATGKADLILHFKISCDGVDKPTCDSMGAQAINSFLQKTQGVLTVRHEWPDWAMIALTVNEQGLRQLSEDCTIQTIEGDRQQQSQ